MFLPGCLLACLLVGWLVELGILRLTEPPTMHGAGAMMARTGLRLLRAGHTPLAGMQRTVPMAVMCTRAPLTVRPLRTTTVRRASHTQSAEKLVYTKKDQDKNVSSTSTTVDIEAGHNAQSQAESSSTSALVSDIKAIRETFSGVPQPVMNMGLLGVVPYAITSLSTLFLSWDISNATTHHTPGILFTPDQATQLLSAIEPVQVGLGAVILSFLGAIHWGLEFAEYGGVQGYRRYSLGILPAILAWPTMLLSTDFALIAQFLGFTFMWFADNQASNMGWTPRWYTSYRFFLTFLVGGSILITLIGRGRVGYGELASPGSSKLAHDREEQWQNFADEASEKTSKAKKAGGAVEPEKDEKVIKKTASPESGKKDAVDDEDESKDDNDKEEEGKEDDSDDESNDKKEKEKK